MKKGVSKLIMTLMTAVMVFSLSCAMIPCESFAAINEQGKAAAEAELKLDEGTEYHAYIMMQIRESWVFRSAFYEEGMGIDSPNWGKVVTSLNVSDPYVVDGVVEDAVIKGNGHYTVKITGMNGSAGAGSDAAFVGILGVGTDIPMNDTIKIDNVAVTVDGLTKGTRTADELYYDKDISVDPGLMVFEVVNTWHNECEDMNLLVPEDSIEISFDVTGFNYDNPDQAEAENEEEAEPEEETETENEETGQAEETKEISKESAESSLAISAIVIIGVVVVVIIVVVLVLVNKKEK